MKLFWMLLAFSSAQDATTAGDGTVTAYNYDDTYDYDTVDGIDERKRTQAEKDEAKANRGKNKKPKYTAPTTQPPTTTPYYTTTEPPTTTVYATTTPTTEATTTADAYTTTDAYTTPTNAYTTGGTTAGGNPYAPGGDTYGTGDDQSGNSNNQNPYGSNGTPDDSGQANLSCFTCQGQTVAECQAAGSVQPCLENETSCNLEIRTRFNQESGEYEQQGVSTGCKQLEACQNNQRQNFVGGMFTNKDNTQCRPETDKGYDHSVCRQCCWDDDCVDNAGNFWDPQTRWQWGQTNGRYGV